MSRSFIPAVDGLRSVAVLSVLLFHAGFSVFSGGFVGVDVFFVISGYLITAHLLNDQEAGEFSFAKFYLRRARRLLPAGFFTLAACLVAGVFLLDPDHLRSLAESTIFALFSLPNIFFWLNTGYWDAAADTQPLLHFWSLGVEEQFYLVWPAMLALSLRFGGRRTAILVMAALSVGSLWASDALLPTYPTAVFYLTPFRAFEFCIGGILAFMPSAASPRGWLRDLTFAVGLASILAAILIYNDDTRFPGLNAILPCIGAALVIHVASAPGRLGFVLENRVAVYIGKISYSVYLAHWPIIVFYKHWRFTELANIEQVSVVLVSIACGALMYHFIEQPFRHPPLKQPVKSNRRFLGGLAVVLALILLPAASAWKADFWPLGYKTKELEISEFDKLAIFATFRSSICYSGAANFIDTIDRDRCLKPVEGKTNVIILGDSHAAHLYPGLVATFPDIHFLQANFSSCSPVMGHQPADTACAEFMDQMFKVELETYTPQIAILAGRWSRADIEPARQTIRHLKSLGITPIIVGRSAEYKKPLPEIVQREALHRNKADMSEFLLPGLRIVNRELSEVSAEEGVAYFDPLNVFCDQNDVCLIANEMPHLFQWDGGHLTEIGSRVIAEQLRDKNFLVQPSTPLADTP
ncbi:MAG: acyltransferase family protein [Hyphomonas sp.]